MNTVELIRDEIIELKELFRRRKISTVSNFPAIVGPYGYIRHDGNRLGVVVNITSTKLQHRTERILGSDGLYTLTNDGEYLFRLDLSDTNRALLLIGLRSKGQRE